jgi:hypothetical protein
VFVCGRKLHEEVVEVDEKSLGEIMPKLAEKHARLCAERPTMIELEFLDEPNTMERFFRIGTDASGMVVPLRIDLGGPAQ